MKPYLIGVGGQFGSGKDIVCNYLAERLNGIFGEGFWKRAAMACNVKRIFCETFGVNLDFIEEHKRVDKPPEGFDMNVRQALTFIGDGFRNIQPSIWIDLLLKNNQENLIISDTRYINECNYVRSHNGVTVLLWRPGHENNFPNRSEQELMQFVEILKNKPDGQIRSDDIPFDFWIKNDGSVEDLYYKIDKHIVPFMTKFVSKNV